MLSVGPPTVFGVTYPVIISSVNIPLYIIAWPLWRKGSKSMGRRNLVSLVISSFFVCFVVSMVGVDLWESVVVVQEEGEGLQCSQTSPVHVCTSIRMCLLDMGRFGLLLVYQSNLQIIQTRVAKLLSHVVERILELVLDTMLACTTTSGARI